MNGESAAKPGPGLFRWVLWGVAAFGVAAVVYIIVQASTNPDSANGLNRIAKGEMAAFQVPQAPKPAPVTTIYDPEGQPIRLSDFRGEVVVLNLWATWCPPCVAEMPALDRTQAALAREGWAVLALSSDRGGAAQVQPFYERTGVRELEVLLDPRGAAARAFGARGLPTSVVINRQGQEVARLEGAAEWDQPAFLQALRGLAGAETGAT